MNKTAKILGAAAVVAAVAVPVYLLAPGRATKRQKTPFMGVNFAHRGLHNEQHPENSFGAFVRGAEAGYNLELDVHLTCDGEIVVVHDENMKRVTGEDILGVKRTKDIKTARNLAMYIIRQVTDLSLNSIGVMFDRDHSTIHSNITAVEKQLKTDTNLENEINDIRREIKK